MPSVKAVAHLTPEGSSHDLHDHLRCVANKARGFAEKFGAAEHAYVAGLWHDLGKYASNFQAMIREANGFTAHIEGDTSGPRDHSSAGTVFAKDRMGNGGLPVAFAIAGHHAGLPDLAALKERLERRRDRLDRALAGSPPAEVLEAPVPTMPAHLEEAVRGTSTARRLEMWIRMLFSTLCDSDFLDTEAFFHPDESAVREWSTDWSSTRNRLAQRIDELQRGDPDSAVNAARARVRAACLRAAGQAPGMFALTAATGMGKTLAGMEFAIEHSMRHGLDRVVVAIPFTSIIEQNAAEYRRALGAHVVLEHHSALDHGCDENYRSRLACENWDAPVIVTTTVQLFDSLFSNRTSRCRKLHRLARSVIILDEVQTLPPGLLESILDGLRLLVKDYGASVVLSTATQPAFSRDSLPSVGLDGVRQLVPKEESGDDLRRVRVRWPKRGDHATPYTDLAEEVAGLERVMVIVHRRADARRLAELIDERRGDKTTFHLSALMCPVHRRFTLERIKTLLAAPGPVRLVTTQLVEAGVDIDFPIVYRALGGLDALTQAAGRCNREGRESSGELRVFLAETDPPPGVPATALAVVRGLLRSTPEIDIFDAACLREYFERLYGRQDLDRHGIQAARGDLQFKTVARSFHLIEDDWSAPVVILFDEEALKAVRGIDEFGPSRHRHRALQPYVVTVPRRLQDAWLSAGVLREVAGTVAALEPPFDAAYDERFGLVTDRVGEVDPGTLILDG